MKRETTIEYQEVFDKNRLNEMKIKWKNAIKPAL